LQASTCLLKSLERSLERLHWNYELSAEAMTMLDLPAVDAGHDEWFEFAEQRCEQLRPHLAQYLDRFG